MTQRNSRATRFTPPTTTRNWSPVTAANSRRLVGHKHAHGVVPDSTARRSMARRIAYTLGKYLSGGSTKQNARRLVYVVLAWSLIALGTGVLVGVFA